jgi:hypothetical protein
MFLSESVLIEGAKLSRTYVYSTDIFKNPKLKLAVFSADYVGVARNGSTGIQKSRDEICSI